MTALNVSRGLTVTLIVSVWTFSAEAATTFSGDTIQGVPVVTQLDVNDLEPGKTHRFMFQGVEMGTGQYWYVPVMVANGAKAGKRVLLVAGVHGDELNPVGAVQKVFAEVDPTKLSGAVVGIIGPSRPGVEYVAAADGRVAIIGTDAIRERGVDIVSILTSSTECPADGCPYDGEVP